MRLRPGWIAKGGAEGLICAASPDGVGVALKVEDGNMRAPAPGAGERSSASARTSAAARSRTAAARSRRGRPREGPRHQRHRGLRRDRQVGADRRRQPALPGGAQALHRGDQRRGPRRQGGRRDRDRRHGLPRRAGGRTSSTRWSPRISTRPASSSSRRSWTGYTAFLEAGLRRGPVRRHARAAGTPEGVLNHTVSGTEWRTPLFNGVEVGETGINAALCGHVGLPGAARHGRHRDMRRGSRAARRRPHHGRRQAGHGPLRRPQPRAEARPRADRGGREKRTPGPDRGAPVRSGSAVRDSRRLPSLRRRSTRPPQAWRRGRRCAARSSRSADDWWSAWRQFFF